MAVERVHRRLAAILAADVAGYSRLVDEDEGGTLTALKSQRKHILEPVVARHEGRIFKFTGDGVLVEFQSAVDAVQCAVDLQQCMVAANTELPEGRRIMWRIGVNLGDVVVEDADLYGDGVNIAARLEALANPGGILISDKVYNEVRRRLDLAFEDAGEQALKNIAEPLHVYRIAGARGLEAPRRPLPLPGRPSVAVLPFTNMSDDAAEEYFSDGITEDIITELSRFRSIFIVARNSSFALKGMSIKTVARELGVAYVVEGSVRRSADRVRITAQLIDADTGNNLWAERYDRDLRDIFALQDEVARSVASTVSGRVEAAGHHRTARLSPSELKAYDLVCRARALMYKYTRADNEQALACAEKAVELDPGSARGHTHAAWCLRYSYMAWWTADRENAMAQAYAHAKRGIALDETDGFAHCVMGLIHIDRREFEEACVEIQEAVDLNPNDPEALHYQALLLTAMGQPEAAIEHLELARRRNPLDTRWVPWLKGIACFTARRYDEAIGALRQMRDPINEVRGWLAASYAHAGRLQEASKMLEEFLRVAESDVADFPGRRLKAWEPYWHGALEYQDKKDFDHLFDGLRKAGLPD